MKVVRSTLKTSSFFLTPFTGRKWSNYILKEWCDTNRYLGRVLNLSGNLDEDKFGMKYREYFDCQSYFVSNYSKGAFDFSLGNIRIDLEVETTLENQIEKFDLVFCHTVFEHIKNPFVAMKNIASLLNDNGKFINIVPFQYLFHFEESLYGDYWRFTPHSLELLGQTVGLNMVEFHYGPLLGPEKYLFVVYQKNGNRLESVKNLNFNLLNKSLGKMNVLSHLINFITAITNSLYFRLRRR
jgi:SAM-dependent methyltransferase